MSEIFKEGYFTEPCPSRPGCALSIRILEALDAVETDYHLLEIFKGEGFGKMVALDGRIALAESDEFVINEMQTHIAAFAHPEPENVLVIGGGTGALVRELLKHSCIEHIDVCERDEEVVNQCSRFFPWVDKVMNDSRVDMHLIGGSAFVKTHPCSYDLILVESAQLFKEPFLSDCKKALRPCGILAVQAKSCLLAPEVAEAQFRMIQKLFVNAGYCTVPVPSRPGGSAGLCFGCDDHGVETPCRRPIGAFVRRLKMYSMAVHKAAFVLPPFWTKRFEPEED